MRRKARVPYLSIPSNDPDTQVKNVLLSGTGEKDQEGTISGQVTTSVAGYTTPVVGATVRLSGTSLTATTDQNGNFTIYNVPIGDQTLIVESVYLGQITQTVNIYADTVQNSDIELTNHYSQDALDQALLEERQRWDANGDNQKGLAEAVDALQTVSGMKGR